jgi:hypothetical protein
VVAQICIDPKEVMFEKFDESSQHLMSLYIWGHIDGDATINLMPYSIFKKFGREDDELVKTNLMLNGMGGNLMEAQGVISIELTTGSKSLTTVFIEVQDNYSVILGCD